MSATVDLSAPDPLGHFKAIERAVELRKRGTMWTWRVISEVMAEYHGFARGPEWWQKELRGLVEHRPPGRPFVPGDPRSGKRLRTPADVRAEAVRRYAAGETCMAIAASLGCAKSSVLAWVREAGVPIRPPYGHKA